ncbi:MAG: hypothetical protein FWF63_03305 [Fibromonadales bacterium]|nr:hypothetical protein [Fibromonadales bacterium]
MKNIIFIGVFLLLISCAKPNHPYIWADDLRYTADLVVLRNVMVDLPAGSKIAILNVPEESKEAMAVLLEKVGFKVVKTSSIAAVESSSVNSASSVAPSSSSTDSPTLGAAEALLGKTSAIPSATVPASNSSDPVSIGKSVGADIVLVGKIELEGSTGSRFSLKAIKVDNGALISISRAYSSNLLIKDKKYLSYALAFIDSRDGQVYSVNRIGNLIWMSQNLNYEAGGASKCFDDDAENCNSYYGRLYKWEDAQGVCPNGWRLPSKAEWASMVDSANTKNATWNDIADRVNDVTDTTTRFSFILDYDISGDYYFWSSNETSKSKASYVYMTKFLPRLVNVSGRGTILSPNYARVLYNERKKTDYLSVRCVANL